MCPVATLRSHLPGIVWPAIPDPGGATALSLLFQLEQSQWLTPAQLAERQLEQLQLVARHAFATTPFYREHWRGCFDPAQPFDWRAFAALPLLSRRQLQSGFATLASRSIPAAHGPTSESRTSGSSGTPVRVLKTALCQAFWNSITLREHLWQKRDLSGKLASIRGGPEGQSDNWGTATRGLFETGPCVMRGIRSGTRDLPGWLEREQPDYLLTYPSILRELLTPRGRGGIRFERLKQVRSFGELLPAEVRAACAENWNATVADMYSAEEVGYMALQCSSGDHYHVQAESVLLEVLNARDEPCAPGEVGRVVVTTLNNFAMPLVRYDIGDYAQPGAPCRCGRGLPVLTRIVGRVNNMLVTASGDRYWPFFGMRTFGDMSAILQHQFVQKDFGLIEARLVTARPLGAETEVRLREHMQARLPAGIEVRIVYCADIARGPGGKYEDFISEIATAQG